MLFQVSCSSIKELKIRLKRLTLRCSLNITALKDWGRWIQLSHIIKLKLHCPVQRSDTLVNPCLNRPPWRTSVSPWGWTSRQVLISTSSSRSSKHRRKRKGVRPRLPKKRWENSLRRTSSGRKRWSDSDKKRKNGRKRRRKKRKANDCKENGKDDQQADEDKKKDWLKSALMNKRSNVNLLVSCGWAINRPVERYGLKDLINSEGTQTPIL